MWKFKKLAATIIALAMTAGASIPMSAASETSSPNGEAIKTLKALEIMVGDKDTMEYRENDPIKRSEFAKVAVHTLGIEDIAIKNTATKFKDVSSEHWASGYINVASDQGLIIGDPDGNFRPDDTISYAEAMTILVRMTGYEPMAKSKGGYPGGYILVGSENSLGNKINALSATEPITRGKAAQMTFNALTVPIMEQTGYGNSVNYGVTDKTILEDKLNVLKTVGIMNSDGNTAIGSMGVTDKQSARIGDTVMDKGNNDVSEYLGEYVSAYAKNDDVTDKLTMILCYPSESKNKVTKVAADDIELLNAQKAEYLTEGNIHKMKLDIADNAELIYNGKKDTMSNLKVPKVGNVIFKDNNGDGEIDLIEISEYRNIVCEDKSEISGTISDKYGNEPLVIDKEDKDTTFIIKDKSGAKISFDDIEKWDVLSVSTSRDGRLVNVIRSCDSVKGEVTEKADEKFIIDGNEYAVAENCEGKVRLKDHAIFHLDADGRIAAVEKTEMETSDYAYLMNVKESEGIDKVLQIKLFNANGETEIAEGADRICLNGESLKREDFVRVIKNGSPKPEMQLVRVLKNADGKICEMNTAIDNSQSELDAAEGQFVRNAVLKDAEYSSKTGKIKGINIGEETIVFDVQNEDEYAITDKSMFKNGAKYDLSVFDMSEDMTAKVCVVTKSDGVSSAESPFLIISKISKTINDDEQQVLKIYGMENGKEVTYTTSENFKDEIKSGDIVNYKTNAKNQIDKATKVMSGMDKEQEMNKSVSGDVSYIYGKVTKRFADSVNISVNGKQAENYKLKDAVITKIDTTRTPVAVSAATAADIQKYDAASPERLLIKLYKGEACEVVIYK